MIRAILFDCFGVLYVDVNQAYFEQFPQYHDELYDLNKQSDHGFIDRQTYTAAVASVIGQSEEATAKAFAQEHTLNVALVQYIKHDLKPNYKIGLLSNIGRGWIQDFFDEHQLHDLFDEVVISSEEHITKPNPLIFERAAQRISLSPDECLFIDDRQDNCDGAQAVGMTSLLFTDLATLQRQLKQLL